MSARSADPARFAGLFAHSERYLGPVSHGEGPVGPDGGNRGFGIGFHICPDYPMVSAATTGVRFQRVSAQLPIELVVSAMPGQEDEAGYLVHLAAERVVQSGAGYMYGGGYVNAEPLIPGTVIEFLLACPHPFAEDGFNVYRDDHGEPVLRFITLIPATRAEFELVRDGDDTVGTLRELWESRDTDVLDIYRSS